MALWGILWIIEFMQHPRAGWLTCGLSSLFGWNVESDEIKPKLRKKLHWCIKRVEAHEKLLRKLKLLRLNYSLSYTLDILRKLYTIWSCSDWPTFDHIKIHLTLCSIITHLSDSPKRKIRPKYQTLKSFRLS